MRKDDDMKDTNRSRFSWRTVTVVALAVLALGVAVYAGTHVVQMRRAVMALFGPGAVTMRETHAPEGEAFDHAAFDALLTGHVDADGWVDYAGFNSDADQLDAYIAALGDADFDALGRDEKLAFLINAYNAFTIRLILDHYDGGELKSIKDIASSERWEAKRWRVGEQLVSLNRIEHEIIRPSFADPRVHWALVCAAYSCPKLRNEAYVGDRLDEQLVDQAEYTHRGGRWFRYDADDNAAYLTNLYNWYGSDFEQFAPSVLEYAAGHSPALQDALEAGRTPVIRWIDYDWRLNDVSNRP